MEISEARKMAAGNEKESIIIANGLFDEDLSSKEFRIHCVVNDLYSKIGEDAFDSVLLSQRFPMFTPAVYEKALKKFKEKGLLSYPFLGMGDQPCKQ